MELLPKQKKFLVNALFNDQAKFLRYVGGFGSGKSFIGCLTGILLSFMFPKNLGVISRSTLVDLKNTTQKTFFEVCELLWLVEWEHYTFDKHEQRLVFENWSEIIFTGLDNIAKIKGMEPWRFYIDEVDEVQIDVFKIFQRRLRGKHTTRRIGFITSNSEWKNRTYQIFVRGEWVAEQYRANYFTIRASSLENKFLPQDYIDNLLSFDEDYFKRYVLGEFNVFEWQIYDEFTEIIHIIDDNIEIPEWRDIAYWHDHGLANPTAIVEWRINHDGELFITREHYQAGKAISYHANVVKERVKSLNLTNPTQPLFISDPSIFINTQIPTPEKPFAWSIADEYMDHWLVPTRWNNSVLAGINHIKELLKLKKIYIFRSCVNLIKEIQWYKREKKRDWLNTKDSPVKKFDHACDALRYLVMAKLPPAKKSYNAGYSTIEEDLAHDIDKINHPEKYKQPWDDII